VLAQSPEADSVVYKGGAVSLIVAGESAPSGLVPQMTESLLSQAISLLNDTGFTNCYVYEQESDLPEGTVTSQSPEEGIMTPFTDEITLWVSEFKDKKYTGKLTSSINVPESNMVMRIIVEDTIDSQKVDFVQEMQPDAGIFNLNYTIHCITSGKKTVKVLLNKVEVLNSAVEVQ